MTITEIPDDVIEDAKAAGLPVRTRKDGTHPSIWITKSGDLTHQIRRLCDLQRRRERSREAVLYMARNLHNKSYATSHSKAECELYLMQSGLKNDGIEAEVIALCEIKLDCEI